MAVVGRFERLSLVHDEFLLLKALLLFNCDVTLKEPRGIIQLRHQFLNSLRQTIETTRCLNMIVI